jgi:hypothetical protein
MKDINDREKTVHNCNGREDKSIFIREVYKLQVQTCSQKVPKVYSIYLTPMNISHSCKAEWHFQI